MMDRPNTNFFLAVPLPSTVQEFLHRRALQLHSRYPFKSWVSFGDYHITLVFLGKMSDDKLHQLQEELTPVIASHADFNITINRLGTFGKNRHPSVLWYGITGNKEIHDLQSDMHRKCVEHGFDLDDRPYSPHITLARKWNGQGKFILPELGNPSDMDEACSWMADEVVLFQSHPGKTPMYQVVERFKLGGNKE